MKKYGELITPTTLQFERLLPGSIEQVWEFITDADKRGEWFCKGSSSHEPGKEIEFIFYNSQLGEPSHPTPDKYEEYGEGFVSKAVIIKSEKPNLFVLEWHGIVTFQLDDEGGKVRLTLTHEKLNDSKETRVGTLAGWHGHLDILADLLNDRVPESFWPAHMELEDEYAARVE